METIKMNFFLTLQSSLNHEPTFTELSNLVSHIVWIAGCVFLTMAFILLLISLIRKDGNFFNTIAILDLFGIGILVLSLIFLGSGYEFFTAFLHPFTKGLYTVSSALIVANFIMLALGPKNRQEK